MYDSFLKIIQKYKAVLFFSAIFFVIPFFWLQPGEMDLGGDDNRLYFYDPIRYLENTNMTALRIEGMGMVESRYYEIPYVALIAFIKLFFSSTSAISFINGLKLAGAFFAIYLIVCEFIRDIYSGNKENMYRAGILAGLFYIMSLGSTRVTDEWNRALISHNQVFLNPLIFYLLFMLFRTRSYIYLWIALLVSFIFAPNFSYSGVVPFFAFYPIAILFLLLYVILFLKKPIPWKGIGIGIFLFLGIHSFQLLSQFSNIFENTSAINAAVFSKVQHQGIDYFTAISTQGMASLNLLVPSKNIYLRLLSFIGPLILIAGFIVNKKKAFLFISLFFILSFFLVTANITDIGLYVYKSLFYIPAFSMFRVFYIKWMYVFLFFYSLLFGLSIYGILARLKEYYAKVCMFFIIAVLTISGLPIFSGELVNKNIVRGSNNLKTVLTMDPAFEETLTFIRTLPDDGKFLMLPLTDFNYQLVGGKNGGAYEGAPAIRHLTTKYGFYGDRNFGWDATERVKYLEIVKKYAQEKNYEGLIRIFNTLNIRYIVHNENPKIYEESFLRFEGPFTYIKSSFPATQQAYKDFIHHFPVRVLYKNGFYTIYEIDKSLSNPTIFIPTGMYQSDSLSFDKDKVNAVFIDASTCAKQEIANLCTSDYAGPKVNLKFSMVNPALYKVTLQQDKSVASMLLVMQHTYHDGWKLVKDDKIIAENRHIPVNGYANGWFLTKNDIPNGGNYTLYIKLDQQKFFWYGWIITFVSLVIIIGLLILSSKRKDEKNE